MIGPRPGRRGRATWWIALLGRSALLSLLCIVLGGELAGQDPPTPDGPCDGAIVSEIDITANDPTPLAVPGWLRWVAHSVGLLHTPSRSNALAAFMLLEPGEPCTEIARAESERILRVQPFLADASVSVAPQTTGGVRVEVETVDEIPVVFGMRFRHLTPRWVRFGNDNVGGQGLSLSGWTERGFTYRTGFGFRGIAHQLFGRPYRVDLTAHRGRLSSGFELALSHPFFTDLQRSAWHAGFSNELRYSSFIPPDGPELSLGVRRTVWNVGAVGRLGSGRRRAFGGALLTGEDVVPAARVVIVADSGLVVDESGALGPPARPYGNLRINAVAGVRALSFFPARGFDALDGVQDVATGLQLGALVGYGIRRFGSDGGDVFVSTDLYVGFGSPTSFAGIRMEGEARRDNRAGRWDSGVLGGRMAWYLKHGPGRLIVVSSEWGGAWRPRVPFQLTLGEGAGGVRGYGASRAAGAWRGIGRLESRWSVGGFGRRGAIALAAFSDAGQVWAGGAPFGTDSGVKVGVGVGLLAAVPARSQRLWRLDIALPASSDAHAGWEVRFTSMWARDFWREPWRLARARAGAGPSRIFTW